ncbi:hypothetical protein AOLI_G00252030 [Acnodon oligacanthus]
MSAKLRECRQGLAAALDQATKDVSEFEYCSPVLPNISGPVLYVSCPFPNDHPEIFEDCSLCLVSHNEMFIQPTERPDCRCIGLGQERFSWLRSEADLPQELPGLLEASSMQTLEELLAKLEFENELNRVCMTMNTQSPPPPARGHSTGSADSGVEDGPCEGDVGGEENEHEILLDTVLEMEQDYDLYF